MPLYNSTMQGATTFHGVRLGVLIPSGNVIAEPDMYRMAPPNVSVHFSRMRFRGDSIDEFNSMLGDLDRCCEVLSDGRMDAYLFACTTGTMVKGGDCDARIVSRIEELTRRPATTTAVAVLAAFRELNVCNVALATPYESWLNELECEFLERNGVRVVAAEGLGISCAEQKARQSLDVVYDLARSVDRPEADCVFISCAGLPAVELVDRLEAELGKPVISSNQASFWKLLRIVGLDIPLKGYGELLLRR